MKLSELLSYQDIVIQCHDNPDADALARAAEQVDYTMPSFDLQHRGSCETRPDMVS